MADDDKTTDEGAAGADAPKSKKKLIMIVAGALLLVAVGGGGWFFLMGGHGEDTHAEAAKEAVKPPNFIDVPEIMVNLAGTPGERVQYLKAKIVLEVKEEKQVELIKPSMPRVTDLFQTYMRELRASDLNGSVGLFRLREELTKRVNLAVAPNQVSAVLFKEMLVQ
ncbi:MULTISPECIES: flagellar basal body-associated protein FliL [Rhodopseudomonas]|uniref:Flagellar protein FliL n=1 Tax=Rhodopseudomonas palustris TaxID=1076 RepID=A0A0D7EMB7_RHOPL|nr:MULTISPECIES: flagellar basal body-associated protein FliL [Rhodopseudomonas]KIZ41680.1 flagellar basal body-associated protein FliL [Rhodopseudomonas palustris]MDF3811788.1 flagellar basal body-associated protein FliL [Rhodopseudomonas sp. BAL398]WOK20258.1 flagellar basal body-associated protein FliL [Rhodopseudomonas sp. BAL398]